MCIRHLFGQVFRPWPGDPFINLPSERERKREFCEPKHQVYFCQRRKCGAEISWISSILVSMAKYLVACEEQKW